MNSLSISGALAAAWLLLMIQGCGEDRERRQSSLEVAPPGAEAVEPAPAVVEIRAIGKTFEGPSEIPSGWTTFRFVNASSMIHFALIDVPPEGIDLPMMNEVMGHFQEAMDAMNAGDGDAVEAAFAKFPEWVGELGRSGGPGLLSPGRVGQATVYLEPGNYILECYVKTDGIFHTTSPGEGRYGMILELTVTDARNEAPEPVADVRLAVRNSGFEITEGVLKTGSNTIRVDFLEQQALPSFVGNDVHLMRVDDADSIALADAWLDWRTPEGLEDPGPVTFIGGLNDMPAGAHGYFTVDLEPGDYAFIAEMPGPQAAGFVLPVTVGGGR
jgi:hypothetical protein